ncbi:MAG: DUF2922 domain-containing protein [Pelosinus sp.]|nr:DUF2922 domain-containing protein [Pelosinus sp.]
MSKTLEMTFRTDMGKEVVMSVSNPKDNLSLATVSAVMQTIIAKNIFSTKSGSLTQIVDAKIRQLDVATLT